MSKFLPQKRKLLEDVFEKAKNSTTESSFSGILKDLENNLREDFNILLSYKTFETYYKSIVEKNLDYNIKPLILNDLSTYLEYENFKNFCEKNPISPQYSSVKVNIDGKQQISEANPFSDIIINITNVFNIPEFVNKHKSSFGIVGILFILGFIFNKTPSFQEIKVNEKQKISESVLLQTSIKEAETPTTTIPQAIVYLPQAAKKVKNSENIVVQNKEKDCMYWNGERYIPVFCEENLDQFHVEQINKEKLKLKKILRSDTLTSENALGKVWYDKSNNKVEFFTHYGVNPENGKTLKDVTKHILEKYIE